jgi:beta-glucuronidase
MHSLVYIALLCLMFSVPAISQAWTHEPLADDEVEAVETMPLTGIWKFKPDQGNVGTDENWYSSEMDDSTWEDINVPGTWNEGQNVSVEWNYEGTAWYRRRIEIPQDWQGGNIRLRFLAVYLISDVWLNDKYLGNHKGGYTEFSFDVSDAIKPSGNVIAVRVDNKKRAFQVPGSSIDWWNCGGITREVFLERHPAIFLKKMLITPEVSGEAQRIPVKVQAWFGSIFDSQKDVEVRTETGNSILTVGPSGAVCTMTLHIDQPRLWSPDTPELYILKLSWRLRGDDQGKWWTSQDRFGIRKIETRGTDIYLNGERIWLQGIAFHQDYAGMGSAVTHAAQRSDLERIKRLNANFVRLGHYPFHRYSLDVCDEIGLLVWSEVPVWQNSAEELANEKMYQEWVKPQIDEMIDQQYNHPSVIFWSVANEISHAWDDAPEIVEYVKRSTDYVRELDSTRLVSYASAAATGANTWQFLDVIGKPLHYGWFHSPNVYDIDSQVDKIHEHSPDKPILAVELCGMSYPDNHTGYSEDVRFSVEYHDKLLRVDMQHLMIRRDFVSGVTLWTLADLKGGREKGTYGILDRERRQVKHIYETIKNLYGKDPKLLVIDQKTGYQPGERLEVEFWSFSTLRKPVDGCKVRWWITRGKGRIVEGAFDADVAPDTAKRIGSASWDIPEGESGFHSLFCTLEDQDGNTLFVNDYYFDVGTPEKPAILWVKVVDDQGNLLNGAHVQIDGFTRITDEFGRVPFLLNNGRYKVEAEIGGETREMEVEIESGEIKEIVCIFD